MSTVIERAEVAVGANLSGFNTAMGMLPKKAQAAIKAAMDQIQDEMQQTKLQIALGVGTPGQAQAVQMLNDYLARLQAQLDGVKARAIAGANALGDISASANKAAQATQKTGHNFRNTGYAVLMMSQAIEDAQYGFSAIVNNIPGIALALGAGPGVAGAASIAAIAINQLIRHWDDLASLFDSGKVKVRSIAEELKDINDITRSMHPFDNFFDSAKFRSAADELEEIRKKTELTADEAERLARASALPAKTKEVQDGKTEEQQATERDATRAIIEAAASSGSTRPPSTAGGTPYRRPTG